MFSRTVIFLAFLGLSSAFVLVQSSGEGLRRRRSTIPNHPYHGPLAQLNKDGTVALTPEVQQARAAHEAAISAEFKRLEEAKRLAAAHPDLTSPPDHGWTVNKDYDQGKGYHNLGSSATSGYHGQNPSYNMGHYSQSSYYQKTSMPAPLNPDGTVALNPEVQQAKEAHNAALNAEIMRHMEAQSLAMTRPDMTSQEHAMQYYAMEHQGSHSDQGIYHSKTSVMPAPLNPDGTVAQTAEYNAIASAHNAVYEKVLSNIEMLDPHFKNKAAKGYAY